MLPSSLSVGSQDGSFTNLDVVDDAKIGGDLDVGGDVDVQGTVTASAFSGGTWTPTSPQFYLRDKLGLLLGHHWNSRASLDCRRYQKDETGYHSIDFEY